eukprot:GHVU01177802.1.p1 GENE.GHVU01177802.1~~GHVU01177802.1.p1  ORF type:complete len:102 (-),score=7.06 GHVU01177802.1:104-409(-)
MSTRRAHQSNDDDIVVTTIPAKGGTVVNIAAPSTGLSLCCLLCHNVVSAAQLLPVDSSLAAHATPAEHSAGISPKHARRSAAPRGARCARVSQSSNERTRV